MDRLLFMIILSSIVLLSIAGVIIYIAIRSKNIGSVVWSFIGLLVICGFIFVYIARYNSGEFQFYTLKELYGIEVHGDSY